MFKINYKFGEMYTERISKKNKSDSRLSNLTLFLFFLFFIFNSGCKNYIKKEERPPNLIPRDQFTKLLVDFALAESAANNNIKNVLNRQIDSVYAFNPLKENKFRKSQYDSTLTYYTAHIDEYKQVYENVLDLLSAMQVRKEQIKTDSVSK